MDFKFNINDNVKVQLTEFGQIRLCEYYDKEGYDPSNMNNNSDTKGEFQLYDLMHIFGPVTYFPAQQMCFENNVIAFELPEHIAEAIEYHEYCKDLEKDGHGFSAFGPREYAEHRKCVKATGAL